MRAVSHYPSDSDTPPPATAIPDAYLTHLTSPHLISTHFHRGTMDSRADSGLEFSLDCIRVALPIGIRHQIWTGSLAKCKKQWEECRVWLRDIGGSSQFKLIKPYEAYQNQNLLYYFIYLISCFGNSKILFVLTLAYGSYFCSIYQVLLGLTQRNGHIHPFSL